MFDRPSNCRPQILGLCHVHVRGFVQTMSLNLIISGRKSMKLIEVGKNSVWGNIKQERLIANKPDNMKALPAQL